MNILMLKPLMEMVAIVTRDVFASASRTSECDRRNWRQASVRRYSEVKSHVMKMGYFYHD